MNRVTVYERPDAPSIYVEYYDKHGRHREVLTKHTGDPVTDRDLACMIAKRMSTAQEQERNQNVREALGMAPKRTLPELLQALHMARAADWSAGYAKSQERHRELWVKKLGKIEIQRITPALAERIAREEGKRREWSPRTQGAFLRYLVDAFSFAQKKLKWITERENLSAVTVPRSKKKVSAYSIAEAKKLLPALEAEDIKAGWIGHVAFQTGRRLRAIRSLRKASVAIHDDYTVLTFPAETDKAGKDGAAIVVGRAHELTRKMMETTGRYVLGVKVPANSVCNEWILRAEEAAGVTHRDRRGWHGFKRLYATMALGMAGREKQSGTTGITLDRIYVQDDTPQKVEVAKALADKLADT